MKAFATILHAAPPFWYEAHELQSVERLSPGMRTWQKTELKLATLANFKLAMILLVNAQTVHI